jgi:hypothetical protein
MLSLPEYLLAVLRIVMRASVGPTLRESSLTGLSRACPANAVEAHARGSGGHGYATLQGP